MRVMGAMTIRFFSVSKGLDRIVTSWKFFVLGVK
jgi:hypothetical protein